MGNLRAFEGDIWAPTDPPVAARLGGRAGARRKTRRPMGLHMDLLGNPKAPSGGPRAPSIWQDFLVLGVREMKKKNDAQLTH